MPGILPMKVIKVGSNAQSRIAQACDRCRSKKIRCDGVTPCCSQCANVGFECKTSDKLSRRAFPRGYTESLEERVRALEGEVRELKDLLDEKDEKIDMLSRIHSFSSPRRPSAALSTASEAQTSEPPAKEDTFKIQQSPFLLENERNSDSVFMGASSGRTFVDAFKTKIQESGRSSVNFNTKSFFARSSPPAPSPMSSSPALAKTPPRLLSDQMINVFFQEWAPLFPVLHRPSFLQIYENYTADPDTVKDLQYIAQIQLVFGIAALSTETSKENAINFEEQWQQPLESVISENTLATLQCLALAQMYCIAKGDYNKLLYYGGIAVTMSHRLGLHQSQKRFSLGALTRETRKKVFWTLYTLDCFSAALLGLPKLMKDDDIHTEYPADVDDENLSERGFQSASPGEATKLCSALALFRLSCIMSHILSEVYPTATSHETSLQKIAALSDELDEWRDDLASHLRLQFVQDKPSTKVVSSRSPLLSLAYYYIRTLLHRPVASSDLGSKASPSVVALADSSKHIIQIVQLLEERHMSFSFCLNKNELLLLSGFGLLFQGLDLKQDGKLIRDNQRLVCSVIEILERSGSPGATAFKKMACSMMAIDRYAKTADNCKSNSSSRKNPDNAMPAPQITSKSKIKHLQAIASRFTFGSTRSAKEPASTSNPSTRRSTVPTITPSHRAVFMRNNSQTSISSSQSEPVPRLSAPPPTSHPPRTHPRKSPLSNFAIPQPNLDYFPFSNDPSPTLSPSIKTRQATTTTTTKTIPTPASPADWERLLGYIDTSPTLTSYDPYVSPDLLSSYIDTSSSTASQDWSPEAWGVQETGFATSAATAQSVFSLSEESLTSGEELSSVDFGADYRAIMIPNVDEFGTLEVAEGGFGL